VIIRRILTLILIFELTFDANNEEFIPRLYEFDKKKVCHQKLPIMLKIENVWA
jgi:hypothetical protein